MSIKPIILLSFVAILANCSGPKTLYNWGSYTDSFHKYNKNSIDNARLEKELSKVLIDSENKGRVPPGLYAEYGYILLESGKTDDAIRYFEKESKTWPESKKFMAAMIKRASLQKK